MRALPPALITCAALALACGRSDADDAPPAPAAVAPQPPVGAPAASPEAHDTTAAAAAANTPPEDAPMAAPIVIDLYHDTVCPWCRIGHERLARALAAFDGPPVTVRYHPFELEPNMPPEGAGLRERLAAKYGADQLDGMFDRVTKIGAGDGLTFRFDRIERTPNTLASHVVVEAAPVDRRAAVLGALHEAYFERGEDIGDVEVLARLYAGAGLAADDARAALADDALRADVKRRAAAAPRLGVRGVPHFIIHRDPSAAPTTAPEGAERLGGAQPVDALLDVLRRVAERP